MSALEQFMIGPAATLNISDEEIAQLLNQVYVAGGYTDPVRAAELFAPARVRARGEIIGARAIREGRLAGMVIFVPPGSRALQLATGDAAEVHLLGVLPAFRRHGLGNKLLGAVIAHAVQYGCEKLVLWTQASMEPAQKLYASRGFVRTGAMQRAGRDFSVYELSLGD